MGCFLRKDRGKVVHTYGHLSPSSITRYWPKGGDGNRVWQEVTTA